MYVYDDSKNDILTNNLRLYLKYSIWYCTCDHALFTCYMHMYIYICANLDYYCACKYTRIIFVTKVEKKDYFTIQMHEWFELKQFPGFFLAWGMFEIKYILCN